MGTASHFESSLPLGFEGFILFFQSSIRNILPPSPAPPPHNNPTQGGKSTLEPRLALLTFLAQFLPLLSVWFSEVSPLSGDQTLAPVWPSGDPSPLGILTFFPTPSTCSGRKGWWAGQCPAETEYLHQA